MVVWHAVAELLRVKGIPNVMFWSEDPSGLVAAHFSSIFFSVLALEGHVSILEAYALALFATQVSCFASATAECGETAAGEVWWTATRKERYWLTPRCAQH